MRPARHAMCCHLEHGHHTGDGDGDGDGALPSGGPRVAARIRCGETPLPDGGTHPVSFSSVLFPLLAHGLGGDRPERASSHAHQGTWRVAQALSSRDPQHPGSFCCEVSTRSRNARRNATIGGAGAGASPPTHLHRNGTATSSWRCAALQSVSLPCGPLHWQHRNREMMSTFWSSN